MLNTEYVQELMNEHGWSLGQLAVKSGISKAQLSRIFSEKRGAGARTMEGKTLVTGTNVVYLASTEST